MPDEKFERLKTALFMEGSDAIADFLGYDYPEDEEKDTTDNRLDEAYDQMPPEELEKFYKKHGID